MVLVYKSQKSVSVVSRGVQTYARKGKALAVFFVASNR